MYTYRCRRVYMCKKAGLKINVSVHKCIYVCIHIFYIHMHTSINPEILLHVIIQVFVCL